MSKILLIISIFPIYVFPNKKWKRCSLPFTVVIYLDGDKRSTKDHCHLVNPDNHICYSWICPTDKSTDATDGPTTGVGFASNMIPDADLAHTTST